MGIMQRAAASQPNAADLGHPSRQEAPAVVTSSGAFRWRQLLRQRVVTKLFPDVIAFAHGIKHVVRL